MESFWQLINEWEIQLLVLLSFILQVFLFFTGSLRRRSTNALLRGAIWLAYLGADMVAIYALGLLSRNDDVAMGNNKLRMNHPLAFLWAPFLLIHLGGQDTITAFAMQDNDLWLRHMLNMAVQVILALYVFWKSASWRSVRLLVPSIFLFITGIIKYGERTVSLMNGNVRESSSNRGRWRIPSKGLADGYDGYVCCALRCASDIHDLFAGRTVAVEEVFKTLTENRRLDHIQLFQLLDIQLCIMYNDLYTKARLLRTRSGILLRLVSHVSTIVALVLFTVSTKQGYGTADIVITYTLLIGGFLLEVSAVLMTSIASPWTWAWLEARGHHRLARIFMSLLSCGSFGWQGTTRPLWSNTMGQYSLLSYVACDDGSEVKSLSQRVKSKIRKLARPFGIGEARKLGPFWVSKLLDTKSEAVDDKIMACLVREINGIQGGSQRRWPIIGPLMKVVAPQMASMDFISAVGQLHLITEACLNETPSASASSTSRDDDAAALADLADICRKLSNYMMYLVVAHPASASLLQVTAASPEDSVERLAALTISGIEPHSKDAILRHISDGLRQHFKLNWAERYKETLEELRDMWARLLLYAAGKSRPAVHAAQLARGGELLTFVWLLMAQYGLGDSTPVNRIELTQSKPGNDAAFRVLYVIDSNETSEQEIEDMTAEARR